VTALVVTALVVTGLVLTLLPWEGGHQGL